MFGSSGCDVALGKRNEKRRPRGATGAGEELNVGLVIRGWRFDELGQTNVAPAHTIEHIVRQTVRYCDVDTIGPCIALGLLHGVSNDSVLAAP
jgi:hypothetical protein